MPLVGRVTPDSDDSTKIELGPQTRNSANGPTLVFDTAPLTINLSSIADYTSTFLYSSVSAQLLRWNVSTSAVVRASCKDIEATPDSCQFELTIQPGLRWQDGALIRPEDYLRRFTDIISSKSPIATLFTHVNDISIRTDSAKTLLRKDRLVFKLSRSDRQFPNKLAHPALGPLKNSTTEPIPFAGGPYYFSSLNEKGGALKRYGRKPGRCGLPQLQFLYISDPNEAIERYEAGVVDCTCPASFPIDRLHEFIGRGDLNCGPHNTFFILVPCSVRASNRLLRQHLARFLDINEVTRAFPEALASMDGFANMNSKGTAYSALRHADHDAIFSRNSSAATIFRGANRLLIAYDDFFPNKKIVEMFQSQLRANGGDIEPVVDRYEHPQAECDFKLLILVNSLAYPLDAYRRIGCSQAFLDSPALGQKYHDEIDIYDASSSSHQRTTALRNLNSIIRHELPVIPVARLNQFYLKRPSLQNLVWHSDDSWLHL